MRMPPTNNKSTPNVVASLDGPCGAIDAMPVVIPPLPNTMLAARNRMLEAIRCCESMVGYPGFGIVTLCCAIRRGFSVGGVVGWELRAPWRVSPWRVSPWRVSPSDGLASLFS
jgi:hypothetical protein